MWKQQNKRNRGEVDSYRNRFDSTRRNLSHPDSREGRNVRGPSFDRDRQSFDTYENDHERQRPYSSRIQEEFSQEQDVRYVDDRGLDSFRQRDSVDVVYREDTRREDLYSRRAVEEQRNFDEAGYSGHEDIGRSIHIEDRDYRDVEDYRDNRNAFVFERQELGVDRLQYTDDTPVYRDDRPATRRDDLEIRGDRPEFRGEDRDVYKDFDMADYRDGQKEGYRDEERIGYRDEQRLDMRDMDSFAHRRRDRTGFTGNEKTGSIRHLGHRPGKDIDGPKHTRRYEAEKHRSGKNETLSNSRSNPIQKDKHHGYDRRQVTGTKKFDNRLERHDQPDNRLKRNEQPRRRDGIAAAAARSSEQKKDSKKPVDEKQNTDKSNFSKSRGSIRRDENLRKDQRRSSSSTQKSDKHTDNKQDRRPDTKQDRHRGSNVYSSVKPGNERTGSVKNLPITSASKEQGNHHSTGIVGSKSSIRRGSEQLVKDSKRTRKNSKDRESHKTSRHSSHQPEVKQEAADLYGSFHDDDVISILADDDKFANETRRYFGSENLVKKEKVSHVDDYETNMDETFQIHADSSASIFEDQNISSSRRSGFKPLARDRSSHVNRDSRKRDSPRERIQHTALNSRSSDKKSTNTSRRPLQFFGQQNRSRGRVSNTLRNSRYGNNQVKKRNNSSHGKQNDLNRRDFSQKEKELKSSKIGRTGAVLKEDRNEKEGSRNKTSASDGRNFQTDKGRIDKSKNRGNAFTGYSKVKRKYFGRGFGNRSHNDRHNRYGNQRHYRNDRNENNEKVKNVNKTRSNRTERALDETELNENMLPVDQNQQIIFIPNPDFQDGQTPLLNQFGNAVDIPNLPPGSFQQMPIQFMPPGIDSEAPPGTEYVFIPFVNNQMTAVPENTANLMNDKNVMENEVLLQNEHLNSKKDDTSLKLSNTERQPANPVKVPLTKGQRNRIRLKLLQKRRARLERRMEKRVLEKILERTRFLDVHQNTESSAPKTKPFIKRISPPSAISSINRRKQTKTEIVRKDDLDNVSADEYENVSDLEDVTDDDIGEENNGVYESQKRHREKRQIFRKPGEPRINMRNRSSSGNEKPADAWNSNDVRKVIQSGSLNKVKQNVNIGRRNIAADNAQKRHYESSTQHTDVKKMKLGAEVSESSQRRRRAVTPIQITVSNDRFTSADNSHDDNSHRHTGKYRNDTDNSPRVGSRSNERNPGSKKRLGDSDKQSANRERLGGQKQGRDERNFNSQVSQQTDKNNMQGSPYDQGRLSRNSQNAQHEGKYNEKEMKKQYRQESRQFEQENCDEGNGRNDGDRGGSRWSWPKRTYQPSQGQGLGNDQSHDDRLSDQRVHQASHMQPQHNINMPFSQQQMQQSQNQFNTSQSFPLSLQQRGIQFVNSSDPSLPPVTQAPINISPFAHSNLAIRPDMSMPPTIGPVNAQSSMSGMLLPQGSIQQQQFQQQQSINQNMLQPHQQMQSFQQQQQQQQIQQMSQQQVGMDSHFQPNTSVFHTGIQISQHGMQASNNSPLYQQNQLQMNNQGGTLQPQAVVGGMLTAGNNQSLRQFQSAQQNPQSRSSQVLSRQGLSAGQSLPGDDPYLPSTPNEALKGIIGVKAGSQMVSNQVVGSPRYQYTTNKTQLIGTFQGRTGLLKVPRASIQTSMSSGGNLRADNRDIRGNTAGTNTSAPARYDPKLGTQGGVALGAEGQEDDDDDFGEMLCTKCDKVFLSANAMRGHAKWHDLVESGFSELRCDNCQQGFDTPGAYSNHMTEKHTSDSWNCIECNITFLNSASLARHIRVSHYNRANENNYSCSLCKKVFTSFKQLSQHKKFSHKEKFGYPNTYRY